jgi:hypothetical protein
MGWELDARAAATCVAIPWEILRRRIVETICGVILKGLPGEIVAVYEVERRGESRGKGSSGGVVGKTEWINADRGRRCERGGSGEKEEIMGETTESAKVVDSERDEGDSLGVQESLVNCIALTQVRRAHDAGPTGLPKN